MRSRIRRRYLIALLFVALRLTASECGSEALPKDASLRVQALVAEAQKAFAERNFAQAAEAFRSALCYAPGNSNLYYGIGLAEAAANRFDQAKLALEQANKLSPGHSNVLLALAQVSASVGELEQAVALLSERERLKEKPPAEEQDELQLRAQLAQAFLEKGRSELALAQLLRLREHGELDPGTLLVLATLENNLGAWNDAVVDSSAVAAHPSASAAQKRTATVIKGLAFKNLRQSQDAIRAFEESIQMAPTEIACLAVAGLYDQAGQMQPASAVLKKCSAGLPDSKAVLIEFGKSLVETGAYEEAKSILSRAVQSYPREPEAWHWLAQSQASLGDNGSAVASLEEIARIAPDYPTIEVMIAQAILKNHNPDYQEVLAHLDRAAKLSTNDPNTYYLQGKTLMAMGRFQDAVQPLQRAVELGPNSLTCYQYARALHAVGREQESRQQFQRVQSFKKLGQ